MVIPLQTNVTSPLLNPIIRRPIISKAGALAWYEKNIIIEPNRAGRLFNNRVLLLERKRKGDRSAVNWIKIKEIVIS